MMSRTRSRLCEELSTISTENPTMGSLNSLPYLESSRRRCELIHQLFSYIAKRRDNVLPLSKPYIDKQGRSHDSAPIPKGQIVYISIAADKLEPLDHIPDVVSGLSVFPG
ncbi:hypothetical protein DFH07DRAFT_282582 [Mycena maculata]|uniref:Uncharacterized protein n=1 Tax=Mycena maculata TaxID=230809 RepID=A0AAD7MMP8_9AGAR|nr:hypothetical protein DFH07DRAFT_282582 [Mycena maculata]